MTIEITNGTVSRLFKTEDGHREIVVDWTATPTTALYEDLARLCHVVEYHAKAAPDFKYHLDDEKVIELPPAVEQKDERAGPPRKRAAAPVSEPVETAPTPPSSSPAPTGAADPFPQHELPAKEITLAELRKACQDAVARLGKNDQVKVVHKEFQDGGDKPDLDLIPQARRAEFIERVKALKPGDLDPLRRL